MFQFANPKILYLLLVVPAMIVVVILLSIVRKRNLSKYGNITLLKTLMPDVSLWRTRIKLTLYLLALTATIFAAARPQFGAKLREHKSTGVEMMLAIDVSNSMLAEDFAPNRLDRTRYAIDKLFARMGVWRIPEAVLLLVAFLGGSSGALAAMNLFHHKTSKRWFTLGIPLMQIGHIVLLVVMLYL
mgnify:CR=1 FL=1